MIRTSQTLRAALALAFLVAIAGGCKCSTTTNKRSPQMELDSERVDFGSVQVNQVHTKAFRIRNLGNATLNISDIQVAAPFAVTQKAPLTVEVGAEGTLELTFSPTVVGKREQGNLVLTTDDPAKTTATIAVAGTGVSAVATITPNPVDFGDVYINASKKLTVTVKNTGSSELRIQRVELAADTTAAPVLTVDVASLAMNLVPGAQVSTDVTFAPTTTNDQVKGGIKLFLDPSQGGETLIPFAGRAVKASPQLCFLLDPAGTATCTDAEAISGAATTINLAFPPTCDNRLYPPDAGASACTGELPPNAGVRRAKLWVQNAGNVPFSYSLQFVTIVGNKNPCGLAVAPPSDFTFSNAPGGMPVMWTEPTTKLPLNATDPMPWETAPLTVTYAASSRCPEDAVDQARVVLTRQGDTYPPAALFVALSGSSKLPKPVPSTLTSGGSVPLTAEFRGAVNLGSAPFKITRVTLQEPVPESDGGTRFVDCGAPVFNDGGLACEHFTWAVDPNAGAPHTIPAPLQAGGQGDKVIGSLTFGLGPDGGLAPAKTYRVNARVETDDPYTPVVDSTVSAKSN